MTEPYDDQNIFAKILRGEIPAVKVYEDDETLVFMDIMPRSPGHCLVIPKAPARNLLDIDATSLGAVISVSQRIARACLAAFDADGITIQQFNEAAGGQEVFHYHMHILPRHDGIKPGRPGIMGDMEEIKSNGEKIRKALEKAD